MKAPDKIVIFPDDYPTLWYMPNGWETVPSGNVEYIRKEALLEWAKERKSHYPDYDKGIGWGQYVTFKEVIDKLNSM